MTELERKGLIKLEEEVLELLEEYGGGIVIGDELGLMVSGTQIDVIAIKETSDGDEVPAFYAGNPMLDGTDEEEDWEELILTQEQEALVLQEVLNNY